MRVWRSLGSALSSSHGLLSRTERIDTLAAAPRAVLLRRLMRIKERPLSLSMRSASDLRASEVPAHCFGPPKQSWGTAKKDIRHGFLLPSAWVPLCRAVSRPFLRSL